MFNMRQALRMARWARNPPSERRLKLILAVVLVCVVLFGLDRIFGWPDFLTLENTPKGRIN